MIRQEDIIKQSGIIEYLEKRLKKVEEKLEKLNSRKIWVVDETQREWDNLCGRKEELYNIIFDLKEMIK